MNCIEWFKFKILAPIERWFSPGYSACYRCKRPWTRVKSHTTQYTKKRGCFPLCHECWSKLSIDMRLGYYRLLWLDWESKSEDDKSDHDWDLIAKAVKEGK